MNIKNEFLPCCDSCKRFEPDTAVYEADMCKHLFVTCRYINYCKYAYECGKEETRKEIEKAYIACCDGDVNEVTGVLGELLAE